MYFSEKSFVQKTVVEGLTTEKNNIWNSITIFTGILFFDGLVLEGIFVN